MLNTRTKTKHLNFVNGVNPSTARKIAEYIFGELYVSLKVNEIEQTYDIYVKNGIDKKDIENFREFWGKNWRFYTFKVEQ